MSIVTIWSVFRNPVTYGHFAIPTVKLLHYNFYVEAYCRKKLDITTYIATCKFENFKLSGT